MPAELSAYEQQRLKNIAENRKVLEQLGIFKKVKSILQNWQLRPSNSTRIRESILATILVTFSYENRFPPLNCIQTDSVSFEFDSRKLKQICNPAAQQSQMSECKVEKNLSI